MAGGQRISLDVIDEGCRSEGKMTTDWIGNGHYADIISTAVSPHSHLLRIADVQHDAAFCHFPPDVPEVNVRAEHAVGKICRKDQEERR